MTNIPSKRVEELIKRLNWKADTIQMGERIAWGSDSAIMREAANVLTQLEQQAVEERDEKWRQQLSGRMLHETFREVARNMYDKDWQGTPFEDLDDKSVRRYNAVAVEVAANILQTITTEDNQK